MMPEPLIHRNPPTLRLGIVGEGGVDGDEELVVGVRQLALQDPPVVGWWVG